MASGRVQTFPTYFLRIKNLKNKSLHRTILFFEMYLKYVINGLEKALRNYLQTHCDTISVNLSKLNAHYYKCIRKDQKKLKLNWLICHNHNTTVYIVYFQVITQAHEAHYLPYHILFSVLISVLCFH